MGILCGRVLKGGAPAHTSFASILKKHGYSTAFFVENTYAGIMNTDDMYHAAAYAFERQEELKAPILDAAADTVLQEAAPAGRHLVIVENGTGHYPYKTEDAHRKFRPGHGDFQTSPERSINDYDNCVYSVNLFLARIIEGLKNRNAVVLYCSDHGQMLGEGGRWYTCERPESHHVGAFIWFSEEYAKRHPEYVDAIRSGAGGRHVQGQIFATILNLAGIRSEAPLEAEGDLTHPLPQPRQENSQGD